MQATFARLHAHLRHFRLDGHNFVSSLFQQQVELYGFRRTLVLGISRFRSNKLWAPDKTQNKV